MPPATLRNAELLNPVRNRNIKYTAATNDGQERAPSKTGPNTYIYEERTRLGKTAQNIESKLFGRLDSDHAPLRVDRREGDPDLPAGL